MKLDEFEAWAKQFATWAADYHRGLRERPVRPPLEFGKTLQALPASPPVKGQDMSAIFADFQHLIVPNMTHWQHPGFFAYFPANAAPASILAEQLVAAMAAQCMLWQTSPAATELEIRVIDWLRQALGLPEGMQGVIQNSASSATLSAVLTMREQALDFKGNQTGLSGQPRLRIYCSEEVHSSIDRAIWVAGIGQDNLVKIPSQGPHHSMDPSALNAAIDADRAAGYLPAGVIGCTGGTSIGACDDLRAVLTIAREEGLYSHVDAAWAGSAFICPEFRPLWAGVELADSVVFNPHKWLGAQFDCAVQFLADPQAQLNTLKLQPEYLKTAGHEAVPNFCEWTIPLGRRFRALKLWFLLRAYGLEGLQAMIRNHVKWAAQVCEGVRETPGLEIVTEPMLSLFSFAGRDDDRTHALLEAINADGRIYLTQAKVGNRAVIRFQAGAWQMEERDAERALAVIRDIHSRLDS